MNTKEIIRRVSLVFDLQDLLVFGGLAAVTVGAWQIYAPLGWVIPGALSMAAGLYMSRNPRGGN